MIPKINLIKHPKTGLLIPEKWKAIKGWSKFYQISNYGRVKSLSRIIIRKNGKPLPLKEKLLRQVEVYCKNKKHYLAVALHNQVRWFIRVHILVAKHFIPNPKNLSQVNHLDDNTFFNHVINLEWVTNRENVTYAYKKKHKTSKYTGVSWHKQNKKWHARLRENNVVINLGFFDSEIKAAQAYKKALKKIGAKNKYAL